MFTKTCIEINLRYADVKWATKKAGKVQVWCYCFSTFPLVITQSKALLSELPTKAHSLLFVQVHRFSCRRYAARKSWPRAPDGGRAGRTAHERSRLLSFTRSKTFLQILLSLDKIRRVVQYRTGVIRHRASGATAFLMLAVWQ